MKMTEESDVKCEGMLLIPRESRYFYGGGFSNRFAVELWLYVICLRIVLEKSLFPEKLQKVSRFKDVLEAKTKSKSMLKGSYLKT